MVENRNNKEHSGMINLEREKNIFDDNTMGFINFKPLDKAYINQKNKEILDHLFSIIDYSSNSQHHSNSSGNYNNNDDALTIYFECGRCNNSLFLWSNISDIVISKNQIYFSIKSNKTNDLLINNTDNIKDTNNANNAYSAMQLNKEILIESDIYDNCNEEDKAKIVDKYNSYSTLLSDCAFQNIICKSCNNSIGKQIKTTSVFMETLLDSYLFNINDIEILVESNTSLYYLKEECSNVSSNISKIRDTSDSGSKKTISDLFDIVLEQMKLINLLKHDHIYYKNEINTIIDNYSCVFSLFNDINNEIIEVIRHGELVYQYIKEVRESVKIIKRKNIEVLN